MKSKIFSFVKVSENSMVASVAIAKYLSRSLDVPLSYPSNKKWANDDPVNAEPLETLFIVNGAYAFAGNFILGGLGEAIKDAKNVVWIQNDFTIIPPKHVGSAESPFRKAFRDRHEAGKRPVMYWSTIPCMTHPGISPSGHLIGEGSQYINWNCLAMRPPSAPITKIHDGTCVYYGSFRKERVKYFNRYFIEPIIPYHISSPSVKFQDYVDINITHVEKFEDLHEDLRHYGLGLYLEDKRSHLEYHSPANRFYEMLSARVPIVFQPESRHMFREKAGYNVDPWVSWGTAMDKRMEHRDEILIQQEELVEKAMAEREALDQHVGAAAFALDALG